MKRKILKKFLLGILITVIVLSLMLVVKIKKSLPKLDGVIHIPGLTQEVRVTRDEFGVVSIHAQNDRDLYKAQGYIQAQDRLFQMDLARRQASGRLAEIVGEKAVVLDKQFLTFSLRHAAEKSYPGYSLEAKQVLQDYADGVNAFIEQAKKENRLPYGFSLLNYEPEKWTPIDSLTIGKYMAYDLGGHFSYQAFNHYLLNTFDIEKLKSFIPSAVSKDKDFEEIAKLNQSLGLALHTDLDKIHTPDPNNGSNNWVISGSKTKSGKPLLADDPHLSLSTPSIWYQMTLHTPENNVSGVIFAGIPGIILGHNEHIAWGVTNYGPDVQDLYIEKQNPTNPYQYLYDGNYYDADVVKHEIRVKGKQSQNFEVVYTKNGPIMNELIQMLKPNTQFSMRWTALDATKELEAILTMNRARNWDTFEKALLNFNAPAQNFVFADVQGNIAFKSNGNIPIRNKGTGILPVPGYDSQYAWKGFIPYDQLAKSYNPKEGYIASANTNTIEIPYHISHIWAQPFRKQRIEEVLQNKNDFTKEDMQKLQMDTKNLYAQMYLPKMMQQVKNVPTDIQKIFKQWDYVDKKEEIAPMIFHHWMIQYREDVFKHFLDEKVFKFMPHKESYGDELLFNALQGKENFMIQKLGGISNVLTNSFDKTIDKLKKQYGNRIENWKWGKSHQLLFQHPLGKANKILDFFLTPKTVEISGAHVSVQAAKQNEDGKVDHGASWRFVYDFTNNVGNHIVGPGQSEHMWSPYYKNQIQNWAEGKYHSVDLKNLQVKHTLTLKP